VERSKVEEKQETDQRHPPANQLVPRDSQRCCNANQQGTEDNLADGPRPVTDRRSRNRWIPTKEMVSIHARPSAKPSQPLRKTQDSHFAPLEMD
jgi:hypothetical protein